MTYEDLILESFNSLQTGRSMESIMSDLSKILNLSFNSLQTGRSMESLTGFGPRSDYSWFQFPSNGKEHGKLLRHHNRM